MDDCITDYLHEIGEILLLSKEEERKLGLAVQRGLAEKKRKYPRLSVLRAARAARDKLIEHNLRLVVNVAKRYSSSSLGMGTLIGEGNIGLIRAAERFNPNKGAFSTVATWWIRQAITRAIMDHEGTIRMPVYMHTRIRQINRAYTLLPGNTTDEDVAHHLGLSVEEVRFAGGARIGVSSLDRASVHHGDDRDRILAAFVPDEQAEDPFELAAKSEVQQGVAKVLAGLEDRDRQIILMRQGIGYDRVYTLEEIGEQFDISRERVRQLEAKTMKRLREDARLIALAS
jgi:RNA polymerase primary sigma factor